MARRLMEPNGPGAVYDISRARLIQALKALHAPYGIYDQCDHQHVESDQDAVYIDGVGLTCEEGLLETVCRHCCTDRDYGQTETCASDHKHLPGYALCPTLALVDGREPPWRP